MISVIYVSLMDIRLLFRECSHCILSESICFNNNTMLMDRGKIKLKLKLNDTVRVDPPPSFLAAKSHPMSFK